jgi:cold shock CspA family protein
MGRSQETFNKKENEKKKQKKKKDKEQKREERKSSGASSMADMIAYVDEYGNIVDTPPDLSNKVKINADDIDISGGFVREEVEEVPPHGIVSFFDQSKGFGFILDSVNKEKLFVHVNNTSEPIKENDKVTYTVERGAKGLNAVNVKKI